MSLVIGTAFGAVSILFLGLCFIGARDPRHPRWAGDFLVGSVYVPAIIMLIILSVSELFITVRDISETPLNSGQIAATLVLIMATLFVWRLMGVKQRLRSFEEMQAKPPVTSPNQRNGRKNTDSPGPRRAAA